MSIGCISYQGYGERQPHSASNSRSLLSSIRRFSRIHAILTSPTNARSAQRSTDTGCYWLARTLVQTALYAAPFPHTNCSSEIAFSAPPVNNKHMPGTTQITRGASTSTHSLVGHRDRPKYRPFRKPLRLVMRNSRLIWVARSPGAAISSRSILALAICVVCDPHKGILDRKGGSCLTEYLDSGSKLLCYNLGLEISHPGIISRKSSFPVGR